MTTDPASSPTDDGPAESAPAGPESSPPPDASRLTRVSAAWVATGLALLLLILLIVFILENSTRVEVQFLGMSGTIPLGMALLIAAVGGGVVVAITGVARVTQLRMSARRTRRSSPRP